MVLINIDSALFYVSFQLTRNPKYQDAKGNKYDWVPYDKGSGHYLEIETDVGPRSMKKRLLTRAKSFWTTVIPIVLAAGSA